jgi:hypothetical protein
LKSKAQLFDLLLFAFQELIFNRVFQEVATELEAANQVPDIKIKNYVMKISKSNHFS